MPWRTRHIHELLPFCSYKNNIIKLTFNCVEELLVLILRNESSSPVWNVHILECSFGHYRFNWDSNTAPHDFEYYRAYERRFLGFLVACSHARPKITLRRTRKPSSIPDTANQWNWFIWPSSAARQKDRLLSYTSL